MSNLSYVITHDTIFLVLQLTAGIGISILYYGTLWLTIQVLPLVRHPKILMLGSFAGRMIIILSASYLIIMCMDGHWERLMACMLGFLLTRLFLIRYCFNPQKFFSKG